MHTVQLHYSVHDAGSSFQEAHRVIGSWCRIARVRSSLVIGTLRPSRW